MDVTIHLKAFRRYGALTGDLTDASRAERKQALADRDAHACEYISTGEWGWDKAALLLRFMHEVCHIPLWQARECAVAVIRQYDAFQIDCRDAEKIANLIVQETGNVLIAEAVASLYIAAAEGTDWKLFWEEVLSVLRFGQPMREDEQGDEDGQSPTLH
ncbi:hypothetical protein GUK21_31860 [Rhizobium leguminosarum]|uniref:hypothetical protein n=1 Tax=Rhizobium ruizarguesonis TaxID=2081791 RepID=UPI0013CA323D|nr:hypothetical protein [Rhizobium ruizarguesonis]NEJ60771.1 hypothetical protein [Rhizobium ruizarguesonis]